jgi:hypothetical protein
VELPKRPRPKNASTEPRDRWIYERCCAGDPYPAIIAALRANAHGWTSIKSKQGVYSAALRYAERHGLPRPANRSKTSAPASLPGR